ncbi:VOC family protein [Streptomyces malaysiensis]|uniref:VOC family protein n=1 Tax=Streptomyces malaysiensis TaxID=92644 RepID=UPI00384A8773
MIPTAAPPQATPHSLRPKSDCPPGRGQAVLKRPSHPTHGAPLFINHIGLRVADMDSGIACYEAVLGFDLNSRPVEYTQAGPRPQVDLYPPGAPGHGQTGSGANFRVHGRPGGMGDSLVSGHGSAARPVPLLCHRAPHRRTRRRHGRGRRRPEQPCVRASTRSGPGVLRRPVRPCCGDQQSQLRAGPRERPADLPTDTRRELAVPRHESAGRRPGSPEGLHARRDRAASPVGCPGQACAGCSRRVS